MKLDLEKRIERLEERKKPRTISTLLDLIVHVEDHPDEEAELSPELQELVDKASRVIVLYQTIYTHNCHII